MKLKEKLCEPFGGLRNETVTELEKIVDDFAIGFAEWVDKNINGKTYTDYKKGVINTKEILETYKKEKGL